ncbi:restriction endonuclease subunit S [Aerococcus urinaeequi]|uniref:restriction endonuclease subunit S n=1 Tax=Aerococcus urinaeequi TaxID=51665 RepID=UPI003AACE110
MNNINWKEFVIGDTFELSNSTSYHKSDVIETADENKIPYITRTSLNNGIEMHVKKDKSFNINSGNQIVFGAENADFFYQEHPFITGNKMYLLNHAEMNKPIGLFLVNALQNAIRGSGFGFSLGMTATRLSNRKVLLPALDNNDPDWDCMEKIGEELYQTKNEYIKNYLLEKIKSLLLEFNHENEVDYLSQDWAAFNLLDFFKAKRGNQNNMASLINGDTPLVSARKFENGYKDFVTSTEKPLYEGNIITLNNDGDGGAGIAYYQPYQMALDTHVTALYPKLQLNKYHLLFITRTITHQRSKFGNNYPINSLRLKALKIMLPIKSNREPDWQFMENYMKQIEYEKLTKIINYLS